MGTVCMRMSRKPSKLTEDLNTAKVAFTKYAKQTDSEDWNWDNLRKLESKVNNLEHAIWCEEYEDNQRRNWR